MFYMQKMYAEELMLKTISYIESFIIIHPQEN